MSVRALPSLGSGQLRRVHGKPDAGWVVLRPFDPMPLPSRNQHVVAWAEAHAWAVLVRELGLALKQHDPFVPVL